MKLSSEIKIGIIVTIAIAVTIWGLNYLKGRNIIKKLDTYYAVFSDIGGLEKNAKIVINGYRVGQVGDIHFLSYKEEGLLVALDVEHAYQIPVGSEAILYDVDFMGTKGIQIVPGPATVMHNIGDTLLSRIKMGLTAQLETQLSPVKEKAEHLMVTIDSLLTTMAYVFDRESMEDLKTSISSSMEGVEAMLGDQGKLNRIMDHMESITSKLAEHNEDLSAAMANMESITDSLARSELKSTILHASQTLEQTNEIMGKVNRGEGTLGMLVNNDSLYQNLTNLSGELDTLLKDLQENPKKYINVSVFGGKSDKKNKK